jgi:hypothetical protein
MMGYPLHDHVVKIAIGEIGVRERPLGSNTGPRVSEYQAATFLRGTGWPWCAAFAAWCWRQAGRPLPYPTPGAYDLLRWARQAGWVVPASGAMPGDIVVFGIGAGHVGILEQVADGLVHTVDGNTSDMVARRVRPVSTVAGYVHVPEHPMPAPEPKPFWVIATSESGQRKLLFTRFATERTVLGLLPQLLDRYGKAGITIRRGGVRKGK